MMRKLKLEELGRISLEGFREMSKRRIVLVLDNIRSALNVGSAFRTADAFALERIMLCGITAQPPHREILKSAIGATESMEWAHYERTASAVLELKKNGYQCIGVEQTSASTQLQDYVHADDPLALFFGNEVTGLSENILPMMDEYLEIPQFGTKHSLNVSVCLGIVVWHVLAPKL
ncbi:MAG: TrmH family RNA methyltransferase [Saprospiraceae bacterium]|nr:TrmH family RNA methyltransferase [Saprospiraceae bacterium]